MAVRIRMKKMGRRHRPFFRVCAVDARAARDGRVIEELGFYDPMLKDVDARAVLKGERIDYWLGVGAQPSDNVKVLIKKYGASGTHLEQQKAALAKMKTDKPTAPPPMVVPKPKKAVEEAPAKEAASNEPAAESTDAPAENAEAVKETPEAGGETATE